MTTCMGGSSLTNLNIQIAGKYYFSQNIDYNFKRYKQFLQQGVDGGLSNEIASGLITYQDFVNGYGFIYIPLDQCDI